MKKEFAEYKLDDFLLDEDFQHWCKNPDHPTSERWNRFLLEGAPHAPAFREAVAFVRMVEADAVPAGPEVKERVWEKIVSEAVKGKASVLEMRRSWRKWAVAAAVLLVLAGGAWLGGFFNRTGSGAGTTGQLANDAKPGTDKATLTLEDGRVIELDVASTGNVATHGNIKVVKTGGELMYEIEGADVNAGGEMVYHTLSTPRGGQFRIVLPDGSRVWLNASSSLRFPAAFAKEERRVEVQGEAYFEVMKDQHKPFRVNVKDEVVEVLGTSFNIMAYHNEPELKTTLLEGSVKMTGKDYETKLAPGQQVKLKGGRIVLDQNVDTEAEVAWKDGIFLFKKAALPVVMRQLERWYDVEVKYEEGIPKGTLTGDFPRSMLLSEVLKVLKLSGFEMEITGKTILVKQ